MAVLRTKNQRDRHARVRLLRFLGLSVLIHLAAAGPIALLVPRLPRGEAPEARRVELVTITGSQPKAKRPHRPKPPETKPRPEPEKRPQPEEKEPEKIDGQIVDVPPSSDDTPPEDAKYLSEHDTRTERETVSRHQSKDYRNAMNERTAARRAEVAEPRPPSESAAVEVGPDEPQEQREQQARAKQRAFELPDIEKRDRLALRLDPELGRMHNQQQSEALKGNSKRLKLSTGEESPRDEVEGSAPKQAPRVADLVPSIGVLARLDGAPANDHIEGVEEGEGTFLNSREFKYASYFNRMKRGVSQQWHPNLELRRRDPSGNIYGTRSRTTVLSVTLDRDGALKDVTVSKSSGVDFLDREAVSAFRRAEPFPNPPKGLADEAGDITFPFGFHVEFNRGGLMLPF